MRLPAREAEQARQRLRKEQDADVSAESLENAGYVTVITTAPAERLSAARWIELYRLRWQIELLFKRWKSLLGFDRIPNYREDAIRAWLYGKLLAAMLLERLASQDGEFFPPAATGAQPDRRPAMARQPWKLTRVMWPLFVAALLPMTLSSAAQAVEAITLRLCANDGRRAESKQVERYRSRFVPETWQGARITC